MEMTLPQKLSPKNDPRNDPKIDLKIDHSCQISRVRDSYLKSLRFISQGSEIHISRVRDSYLKSQNIQCYRVRD